MKGYSAQIVDGDDGYTYIYNPIAGFTTNTYIRGQRHDDKIVVELPQPLCYLEDPQGNLNLFSVYLFDGDGEGNFYTAQTDEIKTVEFCVAADDHVILDLNYDTSTIGGDLAKPRQLLGVGDAQGKYCNAGIAYTDYTPVPGEFVYPPEGLETKPMTMAADLYGRTLAWGVDGSDVYVQGFCDLLPDAWVKGSINDDGSVTFPSWQLMGVIREVWNYFVGGTFDPATNRLSLGDGITFTFDEATQTYTCAPGSAMFCNGKLDGVAWSTFARNPEISVPVENPAITLLDPEFVLYYPYSPYMTMVSFDVPNINKSNQLLDVDKLYYRIYFNDELYTFDPSIYYFLPEATSELPWTLFNEDGYIYYIRATHSLLYFMSGVNTIGCQLVYKDGDREIASNITIYNVNTGEVTTGINSIAAPAAAAGSTEYYDLQGRRVSAPASGLFIEKRTLDDGTISTSKVVR